MNTLLDSSLSAAVTVLFQSTLILGAALVVARLLGRNSSLRYPVLLSALTITLLAAVWTVWNPASAKVIVIRATAQTSASSTARAVTEPQQESHPLSPPTAPFDSIPATESPAVTSGPVSAPASPVESKPVILPSPSSPWRVAGIALLLGWLCGTLFLFVRLLAGQCAVRRLLRDATSLSSEESQQVWRGLATELDAAKRRTPPVLLSQHISSPMVVGALQPRLLVPEELRSELNSPILRPVLAHELAHILRRDTAVGLVERWAHVLLWPQPLLAILLRALDRAREEICDNYALAISDRRSYGQILLAMSEGESTSPTPPARAVAMGLLRRRGSLEHRISEILNPNRNTMTKTALRHWIAPTAAVATIAVLLGGTRISFAAPEDERQERTERREREERPEAREREEREHAERREHRNAEQFEAQVRELRAAIEEASKRGQRDRAHQLELKLRDVRAEWERGGHEPKEREDAERGERREGENFEARVRELKNAMREASERGQEDRAHQLEIRLKELLAHRERESREHRADRVRKEHREGDRFEARVRELRAAINEASERGQRDRAHQLELELNAIRRNHERENREREVHGERPERREGDHFEARVRELRTAIEQASERGQRDRAHQLEQELNAIRHNHERENREHAGNERAAHLERRLQEMAQHMEEMQRAMEEMRGELRRLRGGEE